MKKLPQLIGVIHLPALAGAPGSAGDDPSTALAQAGLQAVHEARILEKAGFEGVLIENFGDAPFYKDRVPPETIASLSVIAAAVRESVRIPLGVNVLRNDARAGLAIASVTGCEMIRVNVLSGVVAADQGLIEGEAAFLARERIRLGSSTLFLADVQVKHAKTLSSDDLETALEDTWHRAGADALIVSGLGTGKAVPTERLQTAARFARGRKVQVYVGSGVASESVAELRALGLGVIVSSALREGGRAGARLDSKRVREMVRAFRSGARRSRARRT